MQYSIAGPVHNGVTLSLKLRMKIYKRTGAFHNVSFQYKPIDQYCESFALFKFHDV
jgi:hypothetical protein